MDLAGKVILITGASRGIGAATAAALRTRGVKLALTARSEPALRETAGPEDFWAAGDLCAEEFRAALVQRTLERWGRIDVLINNAGAGLYAPTWDAPPGLVRQLFELNWFAPLDLARRVIPLMRARRSGVIVNVSSIAGQIPLPWFTLYSASKAALLSLSDGLRMELAGSGVRVMAVCPGYVATGFQQHALGGVPPARLVSGKRFAVSAEQCAGALVRGLERDARLVVTPSLGRWLVGLYRLAPRLVEARLRRIHAAQEDSA
jgi:short-subunit dehydrogenase